MSNNKKYTSEFKKTIVNLYHSGKSYSQIHSEYGVSSSALSNWIKLYSNVKLDDDTVRSANKRFAKAQRAARGGKFNIKKSHCNIHSTLRQRLTAVKALSNQHSVTTLCRFLKVNRSTYYKFLNHSPSTRELENRAIRSIILKIYAETDKRLGAGKIAVCLRRDYCIDISVGRVCRLMKTMNFVQSFSAKGHPYDNAVMECFFKYLKKEETNRRTYSSVQELDLSLFTYINGFYNSVRPHSHNNGLTPNEKEDRFMKT